jgi:hypothetical protein
MSPSLSLERIIWYDFNGFLHVEIFVEEPFFPAKKLLDERWMGVGEMNEVKSLRYELRAQTPLKYRSTN